MFTGGGKCPGYSLDGQVWTLEDLMCDHQGRLANVDHDAYWLVALMTVIVHLHHQAEMLSCPGVDVFDGSCMATCAQINGHLHGDFLPVPIPQRSELTPVWFCVLIIQPCKLHELHLVIAHEHFSLHVTNRSKCSFP